MAPDTASAQRSAGDRPRIAAFRPADERLDRAADTLRGLGAEPVTDPMLAVEPTGEAPRSGADYVVLTSKTGVELAADAGWEPGAATVCAIGPATADALDEAGYQVDVVPEEYTSNGLVETLTAESDIDAASVEIARSDHGSQVLIDGLADAGATVHETVLYRLVRPAASGESAELAAAGELDAVCFTSSLTVEHFLAAADEREVGAAVHDALDEVVVGVIGAPTAETARDRGIDVDVVASEATFETLARETVARLDERTTR
ncbi:uroporphyrinogen-III synthase [Halovivax ruber XH-70]|uniref:Uroporphyrinogen-III synthase n=1 Tax=Halovivax ruber (strain DSM 18193 / JCM 13892 / XH-70) TaxID=797302 RepID=L0II40_HALRX|nr:uroporphyrinogen-III synthase [Halovivax ruber]AGB17652.1 uroporphyrinogen-III synthase [Halovivax ruber XH-70]